MKAKWTAFDDRYPTGRCWVWLLDKFGEVHKNPVASWAMPDRCSDRGLRAYVKGLQKTRGRYYTHWTLAEQPEPPKGK